MDKQNKEDKQVVTNKGVGSSGLLCNCPEPLMKDLIHYLLDHEDDIALTTNDFGTLKNLFSFIINRETDISILKAEITNDPLNKGYIDG